VVEYRIKITRRIFTSGYSGLKTYNIPDVLFVSLYKSSKKTDSISSITPLSNTIYKNSKIFFIGKKNNNLVIAKELHMARL
jgi:hypothetical protein